MAREKIIALGKKMTDRIPYKLGLEKLTESDPEYYGTGWLTSPRFIIGAIIFFGGMFINIQSDSIIRGLRKPGDTKH